MLQQHLDEDVRTDCGPHFVGDQGNYHLRMRQYGGGTRPWQRRWHRLRRPRGFLLPQTHPPGEAGELVRPGGHEGSGLWPSPTVSAAMGFSSCRDSAVQGHDGAIYQGGN